MTQGEHITLRKLAIGKPYKLKGYTISTRLTWKT